MAIESVAHLKQKRGERKSLGGEEYGEEKEREREKEKKKGRGEGGRDGGRE